MATDETLLNDLRLVVSHHELRPVYEVDLNSRRVPNAQRKLGDIGIISGEQNLSQAIMMRLLSPRGELAELGHPEYGSRLFELVGRQNSDTTRNLMKLFILESLQLEARIEKVITIDVQPSSKRRDLVDVHLVVLPAKLSKPITIGPFSLQLEP